MFRQIVLVFMLLSFAVMSCLLRVNNNRKYGDSFSLSIEKAGIPDQMDIDDQAQIDNINMLSEGSQYGVQYFNEFAAERIES